MAAKATNIIHQVIEKNTVKQWNNNQSKEGVLKDQGLPKFKIYFTSFVK